MARDLRDWMTACKCDDCSSQRCSRLEHFAEIEPLDGPHEGERLLLPAEHLEL